MYWVSMNTSWMVLVDGCDSWMLVEVYTRRLIPLPSINTALLWHCGPEYSESYSSQHDTKFDLLKVVICQVPTRSVNYKDFRLIAFFNRGLAYLTGHCGKWINLHSIAGSYILHGSLMPLNTRASFTLSTPSMVGRIAGLLQSSLQSAVTVVCYFPMIS